MQIPYLSGVLMKFRKKIPFLKSPFILSLMKFIKGVIYALKAPIGVGEDLAHSRLDSMYQKEKTFT